MIKARLEIKVVGGIWELTNLRHDGAKIIEDKFTHQIKCSSKTKITQKIEPKR
jgi:hypothetical protein